jgi:NAD(P)-dependent dehydrogenase (short-subunit alcohol dehydrogenase family)
MSPTLAAVRKSNAELVGKLKGAPVPVIVGGTSGIGQGMAETFARWRSRLAHIVTVGRNEAAAEEIINTFPKPPTGEGDSWSHTNS